MGSEFDEESKDGSVYLDELDAASPDAIRAKPEASPSGYDGDYSPDPAARKLEGIAEETKEGRRRERVKTTHDKDKR